MDRKDLKDYVLGLLSEHCDEYAATFRDISLVTSNPERTDRYGRRLEELFREGDGVVTRDNTAHYSSLYVFTGKIYEFMDYNVLYDAVDRWLEMMGVAARDRTNKAMYAYMNRIINVIRDLELRPDLSIMCFTNCVVDMNRLKTYPHSPRFDCVKMYPFKYDRKEIFNCPIWRSFLGEYFMNTDDMECVLLEKHKRRI